MNHQASTIEREADFYNKPEASLCDSCKSAFHVSGGAVFLNGIGYMQRYCNTYAIAIHQFGRTECSGYDVKPKLSAVSVAPDENLKAHSENKDKDIGSTWDRG